MKRRRGYGKLIFSMLVAMVLLGGGFTLYSRPLTAEAKVNDGTSPQILSAKLPWPPYGQAAIGTLSDGVLEVNGDQTPVPMASVAKVMTALAVLQKKPLALNQQGPMITIGPQDVAYFNDYYVKDGSLAKVALGEQISEYQALQALMLPSANNFADTLAVWAFGSKANYVAYANELARNLGMAGSTFTDPSGFDATTVSTAQDLVKLGQAGLKNPVLAQISSQSTAVIPVAGTIHNVNGLLGKYGIDGIKTGNTSEAGGVFLFSAKQIVANNRTVEVIGAVMKGPDLVTAMRASPSLIEAAATNFNVKQAAGKGQTFGSFTLPWDNSSVQAVAQADVSLLAWTSTPVKTSATLNRLNGSTKAGTKVGSLTVTAGNQTKTVPLVLKTDTSKPSVWWRFTHK